MLARLWAAAMDAVHDLDLAAALYCVVVEEERITLVPYAVLYRAFFALTVDIAKVFTTVEDLLLWDRNFYDNELGEGGSGLIETVTTPGTIAPGFQPSYMSP